MTEYLFFNSRDELLRVCVSHVVYFEGDGNYTKIMQLNGLQSSVSLNLGRMERFLVQQVPQWATDFVRLGKSFIVNKHYIYKINIPRQQLILSDTQHFTFTLHVSREALRRLKELCVPQGETSN